MFGRAEGLQRAKEHGEEKWLMDLAKLGPGPMRIRICVVKGAIGVYEGGKVRQQGSLQCR